jgi:hypothetical protein
MLVALKLRIMSIPIVSISIICLLGIELLLVLLMGYPIWKCTFKVFEDHQPLGVYWCDGAGSWRRRDPGFSE